MQLNISTDYAIRAVYFLATHPTTANATEISEAVCIPVNTCKKNLQLLKKANIITSYAGIKGGYTLARNPKEITLADVLNAVDEKTAFNRCLETDHYCNRNATEICPVHSVYKTAQAALDKAFATTFAELIESK